MGFPSITTLFWILVDLGKAVTAYYFYLGSWSDVQSKWSRLDRWFDDLADWVRYRINLVVDPVKDWAQSWFDYLESWRVYLRDQTNNLWWWINNRVVPINDWYNWVKDRVGWLVSTAWNYLTWFVSTGYTYLVWLVQSAYNYLSWFVSTGYTYLAWLVNSAYTYLNWFVSTGYTYLTWLVNSAYNYLYWFVNTGYNYLAWLVNSAYNFLYQLVNDPWGTIRTILGAPFAWLEALFGLNPAGLLAFVRDAMTYWYNIWSIHGQELSAFLADPVGYTLAAIRDVFLTWLEELIAENW